MVIPFSSSSPSAVATAARLVKLLRPEALAAYLHHVRHSSQPHSSRPACLLGLDVGGKKIGVSITDATFTIARPLMRIDRPPRLRPLRRQRPSPFPFLLHQHQHHQQQPHQEHQQPQEEEETEETEKEEETETFASYFGKELNQLIATHNVAGLVVGYPVTLWEGRPGLRCQEVLAFMRDVYREAPLEVPVPFAVWDERMTTQVAREALRGEGLEEGEGGRRRRRRRGEGRRQELEDQVAATIILQAFLEKHVRPSIA